MDDAVKARRERIRHHLRRPDSRPPKTTNQPAGNTVGEILPLSLVESGEGDQIGDYCSQRGPAKAQLDAPRTSRLCSSRHLSHTQGWVSSRSPGESRSVRVTWLERGHDRG